MSATVTLPRPSYENKTEFKEEWVDHTREQGIFM